MGAGKCGGTECGQQHGESKFKSTQVTANRILAHYRSCPRCAESLGNALLFQVSLYSLAGRSQEMTPQNGGSFKRSAFQVSPTRSRNGTS